MKDESRVDELLDIINQLENTKIEIGIIGDEKHKGSDDFTVLGVARANEFGFKNIPERPFIRGTYDNEKNKIEKTLEKWITQVLNFELPVKKYFKLVGEFGVDITKEYLTKLQSPPNHPITIAKKGSSNPLIDTGQLRNSITYRVVK